MVVRVEFVDGEVRPLVILQTDRAVLAWEQFYMIFLGVQQVIRHGGGFN